MISDSITIDTRTGEWLSDGFITTKEACIVASSVLPGTTPEAVAAWYNEYMKED